MTRRPSPEALSVWTPPGHAGNTTGKFGTPGEGRPRTKKPASRGGLTGYLQAPVI